VTEMLADALLDALKPSIRKIVRDELRLALDTRTPRWLTTEQAAERIGISASGVRERIRRGLPAQRWQGRLYIASAVIDDAIANAEAAATVSPYP